jgi:hypothetical protein
VGEVTDGFTFTVSDNDGATSSVGTIEFFVTSLTDLPPDVDDDGTDNAADDDDDNDGFLDTEDPFAIDPANGTTGELPLSLPLYRTNPGTGLFGIGFTGLMTNGVIGGAQGDDYQDLYDTGKLLVDSNPDNGSVYTLINVDDGDAFEGDNTQTHAFQVGLNVDSGSEPFVVRGRLLAPYFSGASPDFFQSTGIYIGTGDQDNYLKIVFDGQADSAEVLLEVNGDAPAGINRGPALLASNFVDLFLLVDPATLTARPQLSVDEAPLVPIGNPVNLPAAWLNPNDAFGLAMGLIQTSSGPAPEFDANYDVLEAYFLATDDAYVRFEGASTEPLDVLDNDHVDPTLTIVSAGAPNRGGSASVNDNGTPGDPSDDFIDYTPRGGIVGVETFTYTVQDSNGVEGTAVVNVTLLPAAIYSDGFED